MWRGRDEGLEWLEFDLLRDLQGIRHAVFLRTGGCSEGAFAGLNVGFQTGDQPERIEANLHLIQKHLKLGVPNWSRTVWGKGVHGKSIALVEVGSPAEIPDVDGLITQTPGISLMMKHADCQVALFYDPQQHAAAAVHAGWRGSVANIYGEAVQAMQQTFGSQPADLLVCVSPSLEPDKAEFIHYRTELPESFWSFQIRSTYFDFWSITEWQLQQAGVLPHHIEVARLGTYGNARDFYSYRRDKITGRHATCITLMP